MLKSNIEKNLLVHIKRNVFFFLKFVNKYKLNKKIIQKVPIVFHLILNFF